MAEVRKAIARPDSHSIHLANQASAAHYVRMFGPLSYWHYSQVVKATDSNCSKSSVPLVGRRFESCWCRSLFCLFIPPGRY